MKKLSYTLILCGVILLTTGVYIMGINRKGSPASLIVETNVEASVMVDGVNQGETPFSKDFPVNKKLVKVSIAAKDKTLSPPYETLLSFTPYTKIIVRHNFDKDPVVSSTEILRLTKTHLSGARMSVATNPYLSTLKVDDMTVGTTPYSVSFSESGVKKLELTSPSYRGKEIYVEAHEGYELEVFVTLPLVEALVSN